MSQGHSDAMVWPTAALLKRHWHADKTKDHAVRAEPCIVAAVATATEKKPVACLTGYSNADLSIYLYTFITAAVAATAETPAISPATAPHIAAPARTAPSVNARSPPDRCDAYFVASTPCETTVS